MVTMFITRVRPAEWLHEKRCLASALISAIENIRDSEGETDHDFRLAVQDNYPLEIADEYLTTGTCDCICAAPWPEEEPEFEVIAAQPRRLAKPAPLMQVMVGDHQFLY